MEDKVTDNFDASAYFQGLYKLHQRQQFISESIPMIQKKTDRDAEWKMKEKEAKSENAVAIIKAHFESELS